MNYIAALTDFFKSPKWMMNLLLGGVCCLVPVLGWIVVAGWLVIGFWGREDDRVETFPDFDFGNLGKYLERGVWPFLVMLVVSLGGSMILEIVAGMVSFAGHLVFGHRGFMSAMLGLVVGVLRLGLNVVLIFITTPLVLRATLTQDFVKAFDVPFVKKFITTMWMETLIAAIVAMVAAFVMVPLGILALCVGIGLAIALLSFISAHLNKQLYKLYLSRGGEAVPLSPKLTEAAPPASPTPKA